MSGEPEVRLVGEAGLGVEEHPLQHMDRERDRIDRERRCIAQLQKGLEDRAQRLQDLEDLVLGSGSCRSRTCPATVRSPRTAETQTSASEMTRASHTEAERVQEKIRTAQTALSVALGGEIASEVADRAHRATLQALEKTHTLLVVARKNKCITECVKNVVQAYDHIDELIKLVGRGQAPKEWENRAKHAEEARRDIRDALVLHCRSQAADPSDDVDCPHVLCRAELPKVHKRRERSGGRDVFGRLLA